MTSPGPSAGLGARPGAPDSPAGGARGGEGVGRGRGEPRSSELRELSVSGSGEEVIAPGGARAEGRRSVRQHILPAPPRSALRTAAADLGARLAPRAGKPGRGVASQSARPRCSRRWTGSALPRPLPGSRGRTGPKGWHGAPQRQPRPQLPRGRGGARSTTVVPTWGAGRGVWRAPPAPPSGESRGRR